MLAAEQITAQLTQTTITTEEALTLFDRLEPVEVEFMISRWRGLEVNTNHPMNGLLEVANWYGKEFLSRDEVHPLLLKGIGGHLFKVTPHPTLVKLGLRLAFLKHHYFKPLLSLVAWLAKTETSQARIRMIQHRQQVSAAMIYDHLPMHDIFRKIDQDTILGLMDYKACPIPFFFVLKRDHT